MTRTQKHSPAKQVWTVGAIVNVGFIKNLTVLSKEPTPGDYAPDAWHLQDPNGNLYRFVPHIGIERV